jgi:pSer/pThr/pTyr-binding forkhead associated (FHA) protein
MGFECSGDGVCFLHSLDRVNLHSQSLKGVLAMAARKQKSPHASSRFALRSDSGLFMGNLYPLASHRTVIGRSVEVEIPVDDTKVSRAHAALDFQAGHPVVVDLGSTNGTFVNGIKVNHLKRVSIGDKIRIGSSVFILELFDEAKGKLKKTWRAPTQAIMRKDIQAPVVSEQVTQVKTMAAREETGIRWRWLIDTKVWKQNKKSIEPWVLGVICLGLLLIALSL